MANQFYLDASALAKRYILETGTPLVNHLFLHVPRQRLLCLRIGTLEVISVFVRKKNAGQITPVACTQAMVDFRGEVLDATDFTQVSAAVPLVTGAVPLIPRHSLNGTDALVLRSALDLAGAARLVGDDLVLVASDQQLLRAAQAEGLVTFNPETQSQTDLDALI